MESSCISNILFTSCKQCHVPSIAIGQLLAIFYLNIGIGSAGKNWYRCITSFNLTLSFVILLTFHIHFLVILSCCQKNVATKFSSSHEFHKNCKNIRPQKFEAIINGTIVAFRPQGIMRE